MPLRVDVVVGTASPAAVEFAVAAERLGAHAVWAPEAWGYDAFTPLAFIAARTSTLRLATGIAQVGARTPTMLAMSAMSMQAVSGGRFQLGLGVSGPQVMEGWHGVHFDAPVRATRETIEIVRLAASGARVEYRGQVYQLPLGEGRPLRSMAPPVDIPIYVAALGPANLRLTGELADGWLGNTFIPESADVFLGPLQEGAARANRNLADLDIVIPVAVEITDDVDEASRRHARGYAFTIGAMGSRTHNFYKESFARQGYLEEVEEVQRLWLDGSREAAADRVPADLGFKTNLLGPGDVIKDRLRLYREAGVTRLQAKLPASPEGLDTLGALLDLIGPS